MRIYALNVECRIQKDGFRNEANQENKYDHQGYTLLAINTFEFFFSKKMKTLEGF